MLLFSTAESCWVSISRNRGWCCDFSLLFHVCATWEACLPACLPLCLPVSPTFSHYVSHLSCLPHFVRHLSSTHAPVVVQMLSSNCLPVVFCLSLHCVPVVSQMWFARCCLPVASKVLHSLSICLPLVSDVVCQMLSPSCFPVWSFNCLPIVSVGLQSWVNFGSIVGFPQHVTHTKIKKHDAATSVKRRGTTLN